MQRHARRPSARPKVIGAPIVTSVAAERGYASIPFVGLAEAMVLAAFRRGGVSLQHIRRAVAIIGEEIGLAHALASRRLYSDGAVILYDYAEAEGNEELGGLTEVVSRQRVAHFLERSHPGAIGRLGAEVEKLDLAADDLDPP